MDLTKDQADLLLTYTRGPHIWDASDLFKIVCDLANLGLLRPVDFHTDGTYELTEAGRAQVELMQRGARHWADCKPGCTTVHPEAAPALTSRAQQ